MGEKIEQRKASTLLRLIMPSEGSRSGYTITLVNLFSRTIDDLRALTAGHNPEATRQIRFVPLSASMALAFRSLFVRLCSVSSQSISPPYIMEIQAEWDAVVTLFVTMKRAARLLAKAFS
jgi:hypothetical protein